MIGVEKKGAIPYWAKSNSKKDRDVALQLLLIYCILHAFTAFTLSATSELQRGCLVADSLIF